MNKLRLGFTDTFGAVENFFTTLLSREFDVIRDDQNPDYLIFGDRNFGTQNLYFNDKKCIKIFYTGENERPDNYYRHFSIGFDHNDDGGRHYRLPLYVLYEFDNISRGISSVHNLTRTQQDLAKKWDQPFCSFVVKNGNCKKRNEFFHRLNQYAGVASGGPLFNNIGGVLPRGDQSVQAKVKFLEGYKFNLCFENASYPGYATEKLFEALISKTVPIYWGSPTIECDFNPSSFLNWHDFQDDDKFFKAITDVHNSKELYEHMFMMATLNFDAPNKYFNYDRFLWWFKKTVYQGEMK